MMNPAFDPALAAPYPTTANTRWIVIAALLPSLALWAWVFFANWEPSYPAESARGAFLLFASTVIFALAYYAIKYILRAVVDFARFNPVAGLWKLSATCLIAALAVFVESVLYVFLHPPLVADPFLAAASVRLSVGWVGFAMLVVLPLKLFKGLWNADHVGSVLMCFLFSLMMTIVSLMGSRNGFDFMLGIITLGPLLFLFNLKYGIRVDYSESARLRRSANIQRQLAEKNTLQTWILDPTLAL